MRIAIVNDMRMAVETLRRLVVSLPGHEVAWIARDGREAVDLCYRDCPDLVLMDLIMPVMDGVEATRQIMSECPCQILIVTATVQGHLDKVYDAMGYGAIDAVPTPTFGGDKQVEGAESLLEKIATIRRLIGSDKATGVAPAPVTPKPTTILIGSSTGGPQALEAILGRLPGSFPASIVIVQHVDSEFVAGLVDWLDRRTELPVSLADEGQRATAGTVKVARTDNHLRINRSMVFHYTPEPASCPYRPSVDVLFSSAAQECPEPGLAILLTGMGRDGADGLLQLRRAGWNTIAQDRWSSVVYGMPRAAAELGAAIDVLAPDAIAEKLLKIHNVSS
ncbi:Chemotaxis response regulator protein-glutamate methylesterase [Planctomycetes bacterium Pan216]|uniref:Protein-glutamate methylesterase/protein-glutamine glutaminase n=1 Tax=Kolteria novifilia TaxID=2527975 RepID=A0A518B4B8_9BACT|nr:Chemotaxis response regulator protein-glutamate methylesterase [Planctomycetes bacterium Pan216]